MTKEERGNGNLGKRIASERVSSMLVCVQGLADGRINGMIFNSHLVEPVPFSGVGELVLRIDEICDWLGTPRAAQPPRFLNWEMRRDYEAACQARPVTVKENLMSRRDAALFPGAARARDVLSVCVEFRRQASIQGRIRGKLTRGKEVSFRSGLELMRMMSLLEKRYRDEGEAFGPRTDSQLTACRTNTDTL